MHEFKPDRWLGEAKAKSLSKFTTFGIALRPCMGQPFAVLECVTITSLILQRAELSLVEPGKVPAYGIGMTLPIKDGLPIRVSHRYRKESMEARRY